MQSQSVAQSDYTSKKAEKYEVKKPKDSDIFRGEGTFDAKTQKEVDYTMKKGERYDVVRQQESDVWKV